MHPGMPGSSRVEVLRALPDHSLAKLVSDYRYCLPAVDQHRPCRQSLPPGVSGTPRVEVLRALPDHSLAWLVSDYMYCLPAVDQHRPCRKSCTPVCQVHRGLSRYGRCPITASHGSSATTGSGHVWGFANNNIYQRQLIPYVFLSSLLAVFQARPVRLVDCF